MLLHENVSFALKLCHVEFAGERQDCNELVNERCFGG